MASSRRAPPGALARDLHVHRLASLAIELQHDVAQVEAEEVAVNALPRKRLVGIRQGVEKVVEIVVVGDDDPGGAVRLMDRLGKGWTSLCQQVCDACGRGVGVRQAVADVLFARREALYQSRERVDGLCEFVALVT